MYLVNDTQPCCCVLCCSLGPPPAPSRGLHKYYDGDDVLSDYSQELKDYNSSTFELDQRRSFRSGDSPPSHGTGCRNGRYTTSPGGAHDDVFLDRCDSKSQSDWDGRSGGYKSSDDRMSSRGGRQRSRSPADSERSRGAGGTSRSRTSQSISPVHRRHSKEHKVISPSASSSSRDYGRHDDRVSRRNSFESPDHDRYSSRDVSRSWDHGDGVKARTVANDVDGDSSAVSDRDRSLRTSDATAHRGGTVSSDASRRHSDASRSHVIRSVVNTTPSWRFDSDYKHSSSSHGVDRVSESPAVDSNHIGAALQKLRSEPIEVGSDSTSSRSKSPRAVSDVDDVEVCATQPDRPPSKGSDDMSHLEKEKSHLLNMLKELEDYSSGGSEIEGLDEESRAVLCRLHRQRDETGDNDSDVSSADARRSTGADSSGQVPVAVSHIQDCSASKSGVESLSSSSKPDAISARRLSETSRRSNTNSDTKKRRVSLENHVGQVITSSLDAEDNIVDLIGASPPAEIPAEFTRRQRASSDVTSSVSGDGGVKPRRSYRPRGSADSADSGPEDGQAFSAAKTTAPYQPADPGRAVRPEDSSCSSSSATNVHRTHSLEEVSSNSRRASTSGPSRKGSGDHQPCIIPDSPVTTRGPDIRPPTEPRTVSLTVTAGGRTIMDLPLPRFALDRHRLRHPSASAATAGEHTTTVASTAARLETTASHTVAISAVTVKTDVAPFSPGLLSPAMSPPAVRLETHPTTSISTLVSSSVSTLSAATQDKTEKEPPSSAIAVTDTESSDVVQKEAPSVESADVKTDSSTVEVDKVVMSDELATDTPDTEAKKTESKPEPEKSAVISGKEASVVAMPVSSSVETSVAVSDSDVSDLLSPGSPPDTLSLEERIRALDEKLNQIQKTTPRHLPVTDSGSSSAFDYSRFVRRRKQPNAPATEIPVAAAAASEPSDYVKSLLSRTSIFDQDSWRLEQLQGKFDTTAATATTSTACSLSESGSSLVSRMRYAGRLPAYDLSLQLPLSSSSLHPACCMPGYRSSDVAASPVVSYCCRSSSVVTASSSSWGMSVVTAPGSGWTSGWTSVSSVTLPSPAPQATLSTPDSAAVRPSSHPPYGMPQTPGAVSLSSAPTDPRRAPRSSTDMFPSPAAVRRQDSSHSSDTSSDAWAVSSSAVRRDPEMSPVPSKPKEMVSPPVSILKKTTTSLVPKDDVAGTSTKSSDSLQSSTDAPSTGMKRTADAAFGKEPTLSTPNKVVARTPKPVFQPLTTSEAESHSTINRGSESDQQKTQTNVVKRPEPVKKPVPLKPPAAKVDERKTDHGTSGTVPSGRKTSEDALKSGSSVKAQTKPHSSISSSLLTSSASTVSKSHSHRDSKPAYVDSSRHTTGPKESSGTDNDLADKHSSLHGSGGSSKPKPSHSVSKESASKDRTAEDQDKSVVSEEKDSAAREKSTSHSSSKHHQSEHRHSDKTSRDSKPDDASKASKVSLPSSTSKIAPKSVARDPTKPDKLDRNLHSKPKLEAYSSAKKESSETVKKVSAVHLKPSVTSKPDGEHKSEKDESVRDKSSVSNMQTKLLKKPGGDSVPASKPSSSSLTTSSSKPKHTEKTSSDRKNEGKKPQPSQADKSKKPSSSTADKNKSAKKKNEKRPEEKREVTPHMLTHMRT